MKRGGDLPCSVSTIHGLIRSIRWLTVNRRQRIHYTNVRTACRMPPVEERWARWVGTTIQVTPVWNRHNLQTIPQVLSELYFHGLRHLVLYLRSFRLAYWWNFGYFCSLFIQVCRLRRSTIEGDKMYWFLLDARSTERTLRMLVLVSYRSP